LIEVKWARIAAIITYVIAVVAAISIWVFFAVVAMHFLKKYW